jgi:DNA transposition AAA+ family ATPase
MTSTYEEKNLKVLRDVKARPAARPSKTKSSAHDQEFFKIQDADLDNMQLTVPPADRLREVSSEIHTRFKQWRLENPELTNNDVATKLGVEKTTVSKYTNRTFTGNIPKLEETIARFFAELDAKSRVTQEVKAFETETSRQMYRQLMIIQAKPQIGIIHGQSGYGKTRAIELFVRDNPNTIVVTAGPVTGSGGTAVQNGLFLAIGGTGFHRSGLNRGAFVAKALKDRPRFIIIDDAHELHEIGRRWVKHLFDLTNCPIALVGNPRIKDAWSVDPQQASRVGFVCEVSLPRKHGADRNATVRDAVDKMLAQIWPQACEGVKRLAYVVADNHGHLRSVWLQVGQAMQLLDMDAQESNDIPKLAARHGRTNEEQAFRLAHAQLMRTYPLPD